MTYTGLPGPEMQRHEIEHVLRAAAAISNENSFVLVGSQAVGLLIDSPPKELLVSAELDLYPYLRDQLVELETLLQRIAKLSMTTSAASVIADWARRRATEARP